MELCVKTLIALFQLEDGVEQLSLLGLRLLVRPLPEADAVKELSVGEKIEIFRSSDALSDLHDIV